MAAFASALSGGSGNWNDGATWGNTSPGSKGTDWPGNAGDTFTITAGDTVIYNVSEANELGASTVNGTLTFLKSMDTKLVFAHVDLTIGSSGKLNVGTAANPIEADHTAELYWNTTGDNSKGISFAGASGAECYFYGSAQYTNETATLANDAENTDADDTIITNEDRSADWTIGDELLIRWEKQGDGTSYTDAYVQRTILAITGTTIQLSSAISACTAGVGSTWTSTVYNITRNVKVGKSGATLTAGNQNTSRPRIYSGSAHTANQFKTSYASLVGIYEIVRVNYMTHSYSLFRNGNNYGASCNSVVYANCVFLWIQSIQSQSSTYGKCTDCTIIGLPYALNTTFKMLFTNCDFISCYAWNNTYFARFYSCNFIGRCYAPPYGTVCSHLIDCTWQFNQYFWYGGVGKIIGGSVANNTTDFVYSVGGEGVIVNTDLPESWAGSTSKGAIASTGSFKFGHFNNIANDQRTYHSNGDILMTACDGATADYPDQDPDGGSGYCIEVSNLQAILSIPPLELPIFSELNPFRIWLAAGSHTITFKVYTTFSSGGGIADDGLVIGATYISDDSPFTITRSTDSQAINTKTSDTDWTQTLAISITTALDGWVDIDMYLTEYEAGLEVFIWPEPTIT
jgi:hypothetical protein